MEQFSFMKISSDPKQIISHDNDTYLLFLCPWGTRGQGLVLLTAKKDIMVCQYFQDLMSFKIMTRAKLQDPLYDHECK